MIHHLCLPSLKLTWPLKVDGWKMNFLLGNPIFRGELLVLGNVYLSQQNGLVSSPELLSHGLFVLIFLVARYKFDMNLSLICGATFGKCFFQTK